MRARIVQVLLMAAVIGVVGAASSAFDGRVPDAVTLRDSYDGAIHHVSGMVPVPPSCAGVAVMASVMGNAAHLAFTPSYDPGSDGACTTETAPRPYATSFQAGPITAFSATVEGRSVPVHIIGS